MLLSKEKMKSPGFEVVIDVITEVIQTGVFFVPLLLLNIRVITMENVVSIKESLEYKIKRGILIPPLGRFHQTLCIYVKCSIKFTQAKISRSEELMSNTNPINVTNISTESNKRSIQLLCNYLKHCWFNTYSWNDVHSCY